MFNTKKCKDTTLKKKVLLADNTTLFLKKKRFEMREVIIRSFDQFNLRELFTDVLFNTLLYIFFPLEFQPIAGAD